MKPRPADWQLPSGVTGGLWDYLHDAALAENYDGSLAGSALLTEDVRFVERNCPRPGRLLDLGCGTGRLLLAMASKGHWVLGVDLSEEMLKVAAAKASDAGVAVHLLKANIVELDCLRGQSFEYAACLFSTLGLVSGAEARRRTVQQVHRLLKPGGRFILHVHNRWFNFCDPQGRRWLLRNFLQATLGREDLGDRLMPVHQGIAGLKLHVFSRREAVRMLRNAGFRIVEVQPLGLSREGNLYRPRWGKWLRSYGYLLAAERGK